MELLEKQIENAELEWLEKLYSFCQSLFAHVNIPSHDHTHHLRVWNYSKDILKSINNKFDVDYELVQAALIASLFHDTGLTKTLSEYHGLESKKICIQYFEDHNITKPKNFEDILFAIEKHDDKNYKKNKHAPNSLFSIICNADDLDAFGNIGVIRYTEIYLLRGIKPEKLPNSVIINLDKRFENFENTYARFLDLYKNHKNRYLTTRSFFEELRKEII